MARPRDPSRNFKFKVSIQGFERAAFMSVEGLSVEFDIKEYSEGNDPETHRKIPMMAKFGNVTLKRGKSPSEDADFNNWVKSIYNQALGNQQVNAVDRRQVIITLLNKAGQGAVNWVLNDAFPASYKLENLEREGDGDILYETIELVHEGFEEININLGQNHN